MTEDRLIASCAEVERAGRAAQRAIDEMVGSLAWALDARAAQMSLSDIVDGLLARGGRQARRGAADALREYERAMTGLRSSVVRSLVEREGLPVAEVARRLSVSRQMVARLYGRSERHRADSIAP